MIGPHLPRKVSWSDRDRVFRLTLIVPVMLIACICSVSGCATGQSPVVASLGGSAYVPTISASQLKLPPRKSTLARRERVVELKVKG